MARVIVVGSITIDEQSRGNGVIRQLGGVSTYGTLTFRKECVPVTAVCNLGGPHMPRALQVLQAFGMGTESGQAETITSFRNHLRSDGERTQELLAISPPVQASILQKALDGTEVVHLGPVHGNDIDIDLIDLLPSLAATVTLDVQGFLRASEFGPVRPKISPLFEKGMRAASIVKAESSEADTMGQLLGLDIHNLITRYGLREMVVTCGDRGGFVILSDGARIDYAAVPVSCIVDTTGAGDVFFAAYVAARLLHGASVEEACQLAADRAARQVAGDYIRPGALRLD